jgi:hypothetical protein
MVIPILSAMQGHPEYPRQWEKIQGKRVILKQQVDNFAIAAPNEQTANILLDMIDDTLMILIKRQVYIDLYNGIDVLQMQHYIKISCTLYITNICDKYLTSWMQNLTSTEDRQAPLPADPTWMKKFNAATGDPDLKIQAKLAMTMELSYRSGVGKLI